MTSQIMDIIFWAILTTFALLFVYAISKANKARDRLKKEEWNTGEPIADNIEIHPFSYYNKKQSSKTSIFLAFGIVVLMISAQLFIFVALPVIDKPENKNTDAFPIILDKLIELFITSPALLILLFALILTIPISLLIKPKLTEEKILLNKTKIKYISPFSEFLPFLKLNWELNWHGIKDIKIGNLMTKNSLTILDGSSFPKRLAPAQWFIDKDNTRSSNNTEHMQYLRQANLNNDVVLSTPLVRFINQHTKFNLDYGKEKFEAFDIESNNKTKAITYSIIFLAMLTIGLYMIQTLSEILVDSPPALFYIPALAISFASYIYIKNEQIPKYVKCLTPVLLIIVLYFFTQPVVAYLNKYTSSSKPELHIYTKTSDSMLTPDNNKLPIIKLDRIPAKNHPFWSEMKTGDTVEFLIRRGGLGLYQFDGEKLNEQTRRWVCLRSAQKNNKDPEECNGDMFIQF